MKELTRAMNGTVEVSSDPQRRTVFTVRLPPRGDHRFIRSLPAGTSMYPAASTARVSAGGPATAEKTDSGGRARLNVAWRSGRAHEDGPVDLGAVAQRGSRKVEGDADRGLSCTAIRSLGRRRAATWNGRGTGSDYSSPFLPSCPLLSACTTPQAKRAPASPVLFVLVVTAALTGV